MRTTIEFRAPSSSENAERQSLLGEQIKLIESLGEKKTTENPCPFIETKPPAMKLLFQLHSDSKLIVDVFNRYFTSLSY